MCTYPTMQHEWNSYNIKLRLIQCLFSYKLFGYRNQCVKILVRKRAIFAEKVPNFKYGCFFFLSARQMEFFLNKAKTSISNIHHKSNLEIIALCSCPLPDSCPEWRLFSHVCQCALKIWNMGFPKLLEQILDSLGRVGRKKVSVVIEEELWHQRI